MERINCETCGFPIGSYVPLFNYVKHVLDGGSVDPRMLLKSDNKVEYGGVLDAMNLECMSCRSILFTQQVVKRYQGFSEDPADPK